MKKLLALILAALMLFALAACGDNGEGGGPNGPAAKDDYKPALQSFMEAYYGVDTNKLQSAAPASLWESNEYLMNDAKWLAESNHEEMAGLAGEDFTITVKDTSKTDVTGDELAAIKAAFVEQKNIAEGDLKGFICVSASVEIAGSLGSETISLDANMVKIGDSWYVAEWYVYDEGCYVVFKVETMVGG